MYNLGILLFILSIFSFSFSFAETTKDLAKAFDVLKTENDSYVEPPLNTPGEAVLEKCSVGVNVWSVVCTDSYVEPPLNTPGEAVLEKCSVGVNVWSVVCTVKLNEMVMSLLKNIEHLENRVSRLETSDSNKPESHLSDDQLSMYNTSTKRSLIRRAAGGKVAFTYQNSGNIRNLGHDHTLKFDRKVTDITSSYRTDSGEFSAPAAGYYMFFLASRTLPGRVCLIDIVKNGKRLVTVFAQSAGNHDSDSSMAVVHLNVGDLVWARNDGWGSTICELDDLTTFAGFLLYPD